ncbi:MAG: endonuclease III, partial [Candidatus Fonsibacter sp.]
LKILPSKYLKKAHHLILLHGRYICKSRNLLLQIHQLSHYRCQESF